MATQTAVAFKPPVRRGMTELDRSAFTQKVPLVLANLTDPRYIQKLGRDVRDDLFFMKGVERVVVNKSSGTRGVLLRADISSVDSAEQALQPKTLELLKEAGYKLEPYTLELGYERWSVEEILESVLPEELHDEIPAGFTVIGHLAHLNLREKYLPYKYLIGQVILDKNPSIRTVVNKLDTIHAVYRTFDMELIAGEEDYAVEQSESGCRFRFNFKTVYWNSRLHTEHGRLVDSFDRGVAVCDVFAGVGPFAIPAAKSRGCVVFANDLNPHSYAYLQDNIKLNRAATVFPANEDGREFIRRSAQRLAAFRKASPAIDVPIRKRGKAIKAESVVVPAYYSHYVMNLPDSAITFLDGFIGLYADKDLRSATYGSDDALAAKLLPMVHVYAFHKHDPGVTETDEQMHAALRQRVADALHFDIPIDALSFRKVRKVSPTKIMFCISFQLPQEVAFRGV